MSNWIPVAADQLVLPLGRQKQSPYFSTTENRWMQPFFVPFSLSVFLAEQLLYLMASNVLAWI